MLGSNIEPEKNIVGALEILNDKVEIISVSNIWETSAVGSSGPNFLNCAVLIETEKPKDQLKEVVLSEIENQLGRVRTMDKNAPRTIDLDLVISDGVIEDDALFKVPFNALPMSDLTPNLAEPITGILLSEKAKRFKSKHFFRLRSDIHIPMLNVRQ